MAKYPNDIYTPREKENRSGISYDPSKKSVIFAEDIKNLDDEVVAIEQELGTNPKGSFGSVKEFLNYLLSKVKDYFTDLLDVPHSYEGQAGKVLKVKSSEDGLEFGEAGVSNFLGLSDTPNSYDGQGGKLVKVKSSEDGLEFGSPPPSNLSDLGDVSISNPSNGQVLTYDSSTGKWKNQEPAGGAYNAGNVLLVQAPTERSNQAINVDYFAKRIKIGRGGTIRIRFQASTGSSNGYVKIYRNGTYTNYFVFVNPNTSYTWFSIDVPGWSPNDNVDIYLRSSESGNLRIKDVGIYVDAADVAQVIND